MRTELVAWISNAGAAGMSLPDIAQALSDAGWTAGDFASAMAGEPAAAPSARTVQAVISVRGLTKRYGALTAVDGISLDVQRGEVFGILGPNGAGKTTTLEMVEGLRRPTAGTITVDGKDVLTHPHQVKEVIGVQPQSSAFLEGLTLTETLEVFGSLYGRRVDAARLLEDVQLVEKAHAQVRELSGGQKQRFSIAVGLVNDPVVLFLDEPTTGLDPQARRNLWELVRRINARGTTVVLTTHYMEEAEELCDRVAIMDHARIVALDATQALLENHGDDATLEDVFLHLTGHQLRE